mmetsp:Transcript_11794/g.12965  ORF Transcript_11794/g.12965 Transcript_11794/m.12965 type:complete len:635 (-) Transcript_11794:50-1954(-)
MLQTNAQDVPLIPRDILFGNPKKSQASISPDGKTLSFLAPSDKGVLNVWVQPIDKSKEPVMVTNDTKRGIRSYTFTYDSNKLLYVQDIGGDENWHVYLVDLETKIVRDITPFQGIRAQGITVNKHHPNEMLIGLNLRDRTVFDMHRIDLTTGAVTFDTKNPGDVLAWYTDDEFKIRGATSMNPGDGSLTLRVRDSTSDDWRDLLTWPHEENGGALSFTKDGKSMFVQSSIDVDTTRLVKISTKDASEEDEIAKHEKCDVGTTIMNEDTHEVDAVSFTYDRTEWKVINDKISDDFSLLKKHADGAEFGLVSRDLADKNWIVAFDHDNGPPKYYHYKRDEKKLDYLFTTKPDLEKYQLTEMKPVTIKARDGVELVSYLTLPLGKDPKNLPLVLNVHGGPWARDSWGYTAEAQWLANRGYAVLQVNFRGSAGFGKKFLHLGDKQWGVGTMQHDLTDAVQWAVDKGYADPSKVAIYGGSYGGYATLAGLTFTPDLYACGVDIVGPSNIKTLVESVPEYWKPLKQLFTLRIGDCENDKELNEKISPLFHAEKIKVPLLIAQGKNDPRVAVKESDQIFDAMKKNNLPVDYVVYEDEGHGFARPENKLDFYQRAELFLSKYLGGRSEKETEIKNTSAVKRE